MTTYIAKRLLLAIPVLFGVTLMVFLAVRMAPGDTAVALAGLDANQEVLESIRQEYGLNRPIHEQYFKFMADLARLDLGQSTATRLPVAEELASRLPTTILLAVLAT